MDGAETIGAASPEAIAAIRIFGFDKLSGGQSPFAAVGSDRFRPRACPSARQKEKRKTAAPASTRGHSLI
jgi:hypothetical protein